MTERSYTVGDPAMRPEPMLPANGPGWSIDVNGDDGESVVTYMLWAPRSAGEGRRRGVLGPNPGRDRWSACWEMNRGRDGTFATADSPAEALAVFSTCPRREEANNAVMALLDAAHKHIAEEGQDA